MTSMALINGQSHRLQHRQTHRHLGRNLPFNLLRRWQPNTKCAVLLMCLDGKVSPSPSAVFAGRALLAAARAARMATRSSRSATRQNRAASSKRHVADPNNDKYRPRVSTGPQGKRKQRATPSSAESSKSSSSKTPRYGPGSRSGAVPNWDTSERPGPRTAPRSRVLMSSDSSSNSD